MEPTLDDGQDITYDETDSVNRYDITIYNLPQDPSRKIVGRLIGLPGETLEIRDGHVLIDGTELAEPYLQEPIGYIVPPVLLGEVDYHVLGDNRNYSTDSPQLGKTAAAQHCGRSKRRRGMARFSQPGTVTAHLPMPIARIGRTCVLLVYWRRERPEALRGGTGAGSAAGR